MILNGFQGWLPLAIVLIPFGDLRGTRTEIALKQATLGRRQRYNGR